MSETNDGWNFSGTIAIGDHRVTVHGNTAEEYRSRVHELALVRDEIWADLEALDGRPATEIVQKEKQWGARSQYGRSYPKSAPSHSAPSADPSTAGTDSTSLLKDQLGATTVTTQTHSESSSPTNSENGDFALCPTHGLKRKFYPAGENDRGQYSASWRCPAKGCRAIWQKRDGSWA